MCHGPIEGAHDYPRGASFQRELKHLVDERRPLVRFAGEVDWERIFAVNLIGVMYRMKCQMRHMKAQEGGGAIVNTASTAGVSGTWGLLRHGCRAGGGRRLFDPSSCGRSGYTLG